MMILSMLFAFTSCTETVETTQTGADSPEESEVLTETEKPTVTQAPETTEMSDEKGDTQIPNSETVFNIQHPYTEQYEIWDITTEVFSDDILKDLGCDGFTGTEAEIAQQIFDWQYENMEYAGTDQSKYQDAGWGARWNNMLPGIYPASKRINHVTDEGKVYGICYDYAVIYCAIAKAYDLECRITIYTHDRFEEIHGCLPQQVVESELNRGMGREEYAELNKVLSEEGVELTYDQVYRAVSGISLIDGHIDGPHGRAEVKLNGEWVSMDVVAAINNNPDDMPLTDEDYTVANWDGIYNPIRLYAPAAQDSSIVNDPIDFDALVEYFSFGPQVLYYGITDDYGNEDRADDFTSFVTGDALLPYFDSLEKCAEFLHIDIKVLEEEEYGDIIEDFYEGTGRPFNVIADFLVFEDDDMDAERYVFLYNGITGDSMTVEEFYEYVE